MFCHCPGWLKRIMLAALVLLLPCLPAFAGFAEEVGRDLGPKNATLVAPAPTAGEWLIDVDASQGVQTGDLFAVIVKGAPVVHPVTRQTIGNLETVKAVLRVTRLRSGYSYAAPIAPVTDLKAGEEARRFSGLPAIFWDYTGQGEAVLATLQGALPDLQWQSYAAAQAMRPEPPRPIAGMEPGLIFVLNAQGLGVKDHTLQPLRFYSPGQLGAAPTAPAVAATPAVQPAAVAPAAAVAPSGGSIVVPAGPQAAPVPGGSSSGIMGGLFGGGGKGPAPGGVLPGSGSGNTRGGLIVSQMDNREGVWYGPRIDGKAVGVESGDFDGDGKNEVALCFKDRLVIARVAAGQYTPVAEYPFARSGEALTLDGLDLDGNGRMELYVTLAEGLNVIKAYALEVQGGKIEAVTAQVPWFLRKVHLGSEGYVLLGQLLNPDLLNYNQNLSGPIFRVSRSGDKLERGAVVSLPNTLMLHGFQPFEHDRQPLLARINNTDKLQILAPDGAVIWESSDDFGGSEVSFERPDGQQGGMTRYAFLTPRIEPGPDGTVLAPVNEGSRTFSAFRQFRGSHLKAVSFDGYSMVERWRTKPQGGYMADFRIADADNDGAKEIVMLVMFAHGEWLKANYGNSALLIYEMQ